MTTPHFPPGFTDTRATMHRVATHIVARARVQATGRFSLRVTVGGFGTPEFGPELRRVRVNGGVLVAESDAVGKAGATATTIDGSTLRQLADVAGVDLAVALEVGHDTMPLGDPDQTLTVDAPSAQALSAWFAFVSGTLDELVAGLGPRAAPTLARLWPEHFDVAIEAVTRPAVRVNLGGSPGDGFSPEPYLYVGPWTGDRPGGGTFWNAPFGATLTAGELAGDAARAIAFFTEGCDRLERG